MTLPTAEQVTNMYLYGSTTRPGDLLDPSLLNHRDSNSQNQFYIDTFEYMATGPGRFVNSANFEVVTQFFSDTGLSPGTYTKYQLFAQFGITYGGYAVNQLYLGTDDLGGASENGKNRTLSQRMVSGAYPRVV